MEKKRNPIISFLFTFFVPGLGHVYNTQYQDAIKFYGTYFLFSLVYFYIPNLTTLLIFPYLIFHIYIIFHATKFSLSSKLVRLRKINKVIFYFGLFLTHLIIFTIIDAYKKVDFYTIPGGSMSPTLNIGDNLTVFKDYYKTNKIQRGDIVVFKNPEDNEIDYIKRVIGLPGDRISMNSSGIILNNEKLISEKIKDEKYKSFNVSLLNEILPSGRNYSIYEFKSLLIEGFDTNNFSEITIPSQEYFVLGDNRDNSQDSRFIGTIPEASIMHKALYFYWSSDLSRIFRKIK